MAFIWFAIIGIIAGWLAGQIMKGRGFGLLGNLVVGVIGAVIGGWLAGALGIGASGARRLFGRRHRGRRRAVGRRRGPKKSVTPMADGGWPMAQ